MYPDSFCISVENIHEIMNKDVEYTVGHQEQGIVYL